MDTRWLLALIVVVLIALVASVVDGRARGGRRSNGRTRPPGRPGSGRGPGRRTERPSDRGRAPGRLPVAGEIWWAFVPYEDGPGGKDRPCLVLSVRGKAALVAKITSKHHEERPGVIALPPGTVGDVQGRASFLETDELRDVPVAEFRRRAGAADAALWDRVRHLAR
ncbi:type II toxin-antitoxin system PemK/MazF family toxin [Streptomyces sp. NBC_01387]|uniref:type II toxin-antitoxin system PemK/MazF family toxin n=1 Tax=unclassified Streptomyces TaxID=2593676 RepID=UPI002E2FD4FD|nr:type II toxin-antitoxin system PemK/MazF family toxin [Streptomyces sp. NBC_01267]